MPAAPRSRRHTTSEWRAIGRKLRQQCPRSNQGEWRPPTDRPDPVALLEESSRNRVADLVPVRYGRMLESPFTFFRGAPLLMAGDLSRTPSTGVHIQVCGDAHLLNFGTFATPERNLIFDLNDFDETHVGPWEWDVKRLAASLVVAARTLGLGDHAGLAAVQQTAAAYRSVMTALTALSPFEVWHSRTDVDAIVEAAPTEPARADVERAVAKARRRTSLQALSKLTKLVDGKRVIIDDPPIVTPLSPEEVAYARRFAESYRRKLDPDRRVLLARYEFVDAARKVVGVGSVGTRCYIVLLAAAVDLDPLFLQIKEAQPSVLAGFVERSAFRYEGQRVVVGQRVMQAASDVFLGWARVDTFDGYVRQLRDMKFSVGKVDPSDADGLVGYGRLCGATLARAHARAGEPALLSGYLGGGSVFDEAIGRFAVAYADQNERDYKAFSTAVASGRIPVVSDR